VIEIASLLNRELNDILRSRCVRQIIFGLALCIARAKALHVRSEARQIDSVTLEKIDRRAMSKSNQREQKVLGSDVFMAKSRGFSICELHCFFGRFRESRVQ
jgi:hypothetical protein